MSGGVDSTVAAALLHKALAIFDGEKEIKAAENGAEEAEEFYEDAQAQIEVSHSDYAHKLLNQSGASAFDVTQRSNVTSSSPEKPKQNEAKHSTDEQQKEQEEDNPAAPNEEAMLVEPGEVVAQAPNGPQQPLNVSPIRAAKARPTKIALPPGQAEDEEELLNAMEADELADYEDVCDESPVKVLTTTSDEMSPEKRELCRRMFLQQSPDYQVVYEHGFLCVGEQENFKVLMSKAYTFRVA